MSMNAMHCNDQSFHYAHKYTWLKNGLLKQIRRHLGTVQLQSSWAHMQTSSSDRR
jgi:hypothetical protein